MEEDRKLDGVNEANVQNTENYFTFTVAGHLIQGGYDIKAATGGMMINFPNSFKGGTKPVILLAPQWPGGQVGYIETLVVVASQYFTFTSQNAASDYRVGWIAIGVAP